MNDRFDRWVRSPGFWATLREWLILGALVLSPVSVVIKLVYSLPFPWIDPTLILGAAAALLPPWPLPPADRRLRGVAVCAVLFLGTYWLSATLSVAAAQFPGAEPFREPVRTALGILLCVGCVRVWTKGSALQRAAVVLGWVAVVEVLLAVYLLAGLALNLPMPAQWRSYQEIYWFRQAFYAGKIVWPRLGGTFVEAPPFGLYVLGAIIMLSFARRTTPRDSPPMPGRWMDAILWLGLAGSLSSQVLIGAMLWGLLLAGFDLYVRRQPTLWHVVGVVVLLTLFSGGVYKKYLESKRPQPEIGSSVGERRAHTTRAWRTFLSHPILGVGPGQYGEVAMRESFSLYDVRVSPQFVPAELLADSGALGFGTAVLLVASILFALLRSGNYSAVSAAAGLLVADGFQANWRWPMLFIAIAVLLVVSTSQTSGEQDIPEATG
jgi:hypothetical protein